MKSTALFLSLVTVCTQTVCMENQPLIRSTTPQPISYPSSSYSSYQLPPTTRPTQLLASRSLREMLAPRRPQFEPLLAQEVREKHITLLEKMGSQHAESRLLKLIAIVSTVNLIKESVQFWIWGVNSNAQLTDMVAPNHTMTTKPACHDDCWQHCTEYGCYVRCTPCGREASLTAVAYPSVGLWLVNLGIVSFSLLQLINNRFNRKLSQAEFIQMLLDCDSMTENPASSDLSDTEAMKMSAPTRLSTMLDHQIAHDIELKDQAAIDQVREKTLNFIKTLGQLKTSTKLYALLGAACGVNMLADVLVGSLSGISKDYPQSTANATLNVTNSSSCQTICVPSNCCFGPECLGKICPCVNTTLCDQDQLFTANSLGQVNFGMGVLNFFTGLTCAYLASSSYQATKTHALEMQKLFKDLDELNEPGPVYQADTNSL